MSRELCSFGAWDQTVIKKLCELSIERKRGHVITITGRFVVNPVEAQWKRRGYLELTFAVLLCSQVLQRNTRGHRCLRRNERRIFCERQTVVA